INADSAWTLTKGKSNIAIAVLDDGLQADHIDIPNTRQLRLPRSNIMAYADLSLPDDPSPYSVPNQYQPHGTACAGIIGATQDNGIGTAGIAPLCKIMPIRVKSVFVVTTFSDFARAVLFADTNGARVMSIS